MNLTVHNICPNCFSAKNGQPVCLKCRYDIRNLRENSAALPVFTILHQKYIVGRVLGQGGFGITYIAWDFSRKERCCIKEYMPSEFAVREMHSKEILPKDQKSRPIYKKGQERFILEARTLFTLRNAFNIVQYRDYFIENQTAYIVMEFLEGCNLRRYVNERGGRIDWRMATEMLLSTGSTLMEIHKKNILHRDISPENIFVKTTPSGRFLDYVLIDFGAAKNLIAAQNGENSVLLKPGYAPPEQHRRDGILTRSSDIYSLAATYYNVITGKYIPDAYVRSRGDRYTPLSKTGLHVPPVISDAIDKALELESRNRFQNCEQFLDMIGRGYVPSVSQTSGSHIPVQQNTDDKPVVSNQKNAAMIIMRQENNVLKKFEIPANQSIKIGRRSADCDVVIDEKEAPFTISRVHCIVNYKNEKGIFLVTDISSNGTFDQKGGRLIKNKPYFFNAGAQIYIVKKGIKYSFEFNIE